MRIGLQFTLRHEGPLAAAVAEILDALRKFWNGKELTLPLEIVIGTRP
jgi:hypothetical protein